MLIAARIGLARIVRTVAQASARLQRVDRPRIAAVAGRWLQTPDLRRARRPFGVRLTQRGFRQATVCAASATVLLVGSLVFAEPPPPVSPRRVPLVPAAPIWIVDKAASRLTFRGTASGQNVDGVFKKWDAQIAFDPKNLRASHAVVTVDIASVVTGDPTRDQMLPSADWFAAARFPEATFVTVAIIPVGPDRYQALGDLKVRGVSRRVTMPFTLTIDKDIATMTGALTLNRSQFGVGQGQFAAADPVASGVAVIVRLTAKTSH